MARPKELIGIGAFARRVRLSPRQLRDYDELGLLAPAHRSESGYRLYRDEDVERLYRIVALRRLGLGLGDIVSALDGDGAELGEVVRRHRDAVVRELAERAALRGRLDELCAVLDRGAEPSIDELITTMEAMQMHEKYFDAAQREQIRRRGEELGDDGIADAERGWAELFGELGTHMRAGTDPADPALDPIRARARELLAAFTGGDPGIAASMRRMWDSEDPTEVSRGAVDRELFAYSRRVFGARDDVR